ncbi:MAG: DNA mismatch repair protein MutS [Oscillospiraceae bacterium]|nr:DNA mismatch repair protein MutS [Oscillospiraceae bacterium]
MAKLSPMMQQYLDIKERHKDHIVFFRLGDFYEMFFDDALLASKELELTLTGRDCGLEERAPMCGIPYHSSEAYIQRLIEKGYKVAICEQTEQPQKGKTIVNRDVIRVVTPGTILENSMLSEDKNNYIASVFIDKDNKFNLCFCDISTGSMHTTAIACENLQNNVQSELFKYKPSEIVINSRILDFKWLTDYIKNILKCPVELKSDDEYNTITATEKVKTYFADNSFDENMVFCIWQLLDYLEDTQKVGIDNISQVEAYEQNNFMKLSYTTISNLELFETIRSKEKKGSLLWVIDNTKTSFGKRMMRQVLSAPLMDKNAIDARLDCVEFLNKNLVTRMEIQNILKGIQDMERLCSRASFGNASPRDVFSLSVSLKNLLPLKSLLAQCDNKLISALNMDINPLTELCDVLDRAIIENPPALAKDGGMIKDGYNEEIDRLRNLVNNSMGILAGIENRLKEETGIPKLKIGYNRVFGYYIEVTRSYLNLVPPTFFRKQTLAGAERFITEELKDLEQEILSASDKLLALEKELFSDLLKQISSNSKEILTTTKALSYIDVMAAFSETSIKNNYVKPTVTAGDRTYIKDGRHPVVEAMLKDEIFIPNDTLLDCSDNRVSIITGPNMAGKSTYMRQVAIITVMAQIGCFVPAREAEISIADAIFTRVGASDDLSSGRSTFMVEMSEVSEILKNATTKSLVILDEIGRGTSTFDGMSIAKAVVEYIYDKKNNLGCKTLFATHYHELTDMENKFNGVVNYNIAVKKRGDEITFLRKIVKGGADDSFGIQVAKLAGVPDAVIERAKVILAELEENARREKMAVRQLSFDDALPLIVEQNEREVPNEIIKELEKVDVNVLTPIEALNILNKLKSLL